MDIKDNLKCEMCKEAQWKYKCPCCTIRTCCISCVTAHKMRSGCSGKRDKTAYVAVREYRDIHLLSDYRFLEDGGRKADTAYRDPLKYQGRKMPRFLNRLLQQARHRQIELYIMPMQFSKRKTNSTYFNEKLKTIMWNVEWHFPAVDLKLKDKKVDESSKLEEVLEKYLVAGKGDPVVQHKLLPYVTRGLHQCKLFMKIERRRAKNIRYHELDVTKSVTDNLRQKVVVEYPSIHVVLADRASQYKTLNPDGTDKEPEGSEDSSSDSGSSDSDSSDSDSSDSDAEEPVVKKPCLQNTEKTQPQVNAKDNNDSGVHTEDVVNSSSSVSSNNSTCDQPAKVEASVAGQDSKDDINQVTKDNGIDKKETEPEAT